MCMSALFVFCSFVLFDSEFVKTLLDGSETAWQKLGDESSPPEQDLKTLADLADKLARWVPRSFLKEHAADSLPLNRGEVLRLRGNVIFVTQYDGVYHCKMEQNNEVIDLFVPSIPKAWKQDVSIRERSAAFGVYVKSYQERHVFAAPAVQWYPDTWLGNLGFDVGSFDRVPVSRVTELEQHDEETNRRTFKFTESDSEPFYGLLQAVSATPAGWLEEEAMKQQTQTQQAETPFNVTDLFNRPHEMRGKPVLLRGTAKRIVPTPVTDSEVQSLFGIDCYYQIYLFTDQSQGHPLVVCVRSLPEGMPAGDAGDFSETITVAAILYKLWIYETPEGPHYAPVLVGRSPVWHPHSQPLPSVTAFSLTLFFTLVLIWFGCRCWARRK